MRVTEGTSYEQTDGTWQKPEIELDDSDLERALVELGVSSEQAAGLSLMTRYALMSALARRMLVAVQLQNTRRFDLEWAEKTGKPLFAAVTSELQELLGKIKGAS